MGAHERLRALMANNATASVVIPAIAAPLAYLAVYMFRYPVYLLHDADFGGTWTDVKTYVSIASVLGMALAKYPAILVISTLNPSQRWLFGGFLTYFEGRQSSEILNAALNGVVVFGSAAARAIGTSVLQYVAPSAMPLLVVIFFAPLYISMLYVLDAIPPPSRADEEARTMRRAMPAAERSRFLRRYGLGLAPVFLFYMLLLSFRSYRDFFAVDIYSHLLGRAPTSSDYILADWPGMGTLLALVPFSGALFDRLIAATGTPGTSIFLVFLGDGLAYVSTLATLASRLGVRNHENEGHTFVLVAMSIMPVIAGLALLAMLAFGWLLRRRHNEAGYIPVRQADDDFGADCHDAGDDIQERVERIELGNLGEPVPGRTPGTGEDAELKIRASAHVRQHVRRSSASAPISTSESRL
ncbi:uncharacterized protein MONBRDRAFT_28081 [Monosiga brevicollis MX1]|uniref:Uncharacterized protein n=1 Tax=Monosiga brevicollis TaxID=81824 RepID=A9V752_MONBE|nr:uncharacterized protein MONBRDRAFT_28081 [Monosiga brevicollis MX1]EDQ86729.1 predicted protein [Monosiga brevicollis MX1]|eukprot:XP_001748565.1 hypothetical protein [Monosiga brevicollis MX1]